MRCAVPGSNRNGDERRAGQTKPTRRSEKRNAKSEQRTANSEQRQAKEKQKAQAKTTDNSEYKLFLLPQVTLCLLASNTSAAATTHLRWLSSALGVRVGVAPSSASNLCMGRGLRALPLAHLSCAAMPSCPAHPLFTVSLRHLHVHRLLRLLAVASSSPHSPSVISATTASFVAPDTVDTLRDVAASPRRRVAASCLWKAITKLFDNERRTTNDERRTTKSNFDDF